MNRNRPEAAEMPPGGSEFSDRTIRCDRCDEPATRTYEGVEFLQLCEACYEDLGRWLARG